MVVPGHQRGHILGFPTANVGGHDAQDLPPDGVYCAMVFLPHLAQHFGATVSMGWNPTFDDVLEHRVEAHLHDFAESIYGRAIEVTLLAHLRDMRRFADGTELTRQIAADVERSRSILASQPQAGAAFRRPAADGSSVPHIG